MQSSPTVGKGHKVREVKAGKAAVNVLKSSLYYEAEVWLW